MNLSLANSPLKSPLSVRTLCTVPRTRWKTFSMRLVFLCPLQFCLCSCGNNSFFYKYGVKKREACFLFVLFLFVITLVKAFWLLNASHWKIVITPKRSIRDSIRQHFTLCILGKVYIIFLLVNFLSYIFGICLIGIMRCFKYNYVSFVSI